MKTLHTMSLNHMYHVSSCGSRLPMYNGRFSQNGHTQQKSYLNIFMLLSKSMITLYAIFNQALQYSSYKEFVKCRMLLLTPVYTDTVLFESPSGEILVSQSTSHLIMTRVTPLCSRKVRICNNESLGKPIVFC